MILRSLLNLRATSDLPLIPLSAGMRGSWLWEALGGGEGTNIIVNERSAMGLSAVATCVNIICGAIASLPLKVYQRELHGRRVAREHRLYSILHDQPSAEDTSYNLRHKMQGNVLIWGNAYTETEKDNASRVRALYHHSPNNVKIELGSRRGEFWYVVTDTGGDRRVIPENMIHLRGFTHEGIAGLSVIQNHRRALGIAVRQEVFATNFLDNGARGSGVLMYPGKLSDKARVNLTESFEEKHKGAENAGKTILLEEGTKYQQLTIPPNDAQFLESKKLSRAEIAGMFRVPAMLVPGADGTSPTYASSEKFMRYFIDFCLRDWLTLWQQELNAKLFTGDYYCEFDLRDLLRGDAEARAQLHKALWEVGAKSANDISADENENPVPGGDRYYVPLNYIPVDKVDEQLAAKLKPDPAPVAASSAGDGKGMNGGSTQGQKDLPQGYKRLFTETVREIQKWESFSEKRAAAKLSAYVLRPMADDLIGAERGDEFLTQYASALAQRVRTLESIEIELEKAVSEIRAHGGIDV